MAKKRYGNFWAHRAASATRAANANAPAWRGLAFVLLLGAWIVCGWLGWHNAGKAPMDALYTTFTMLGAGKEFTSVDGWLLEIARYGGLLLPFVGVFFAFSGLVFRTLARVYLHFAKGHIVIAGEDAAALHLAQRCAKTGHVVVLIGRSLAEETLKGLAKQKIIVLKGDASVPQVLISARAALARHVCAMTADEVENLRIEAACQHVAAQKRKSGAAPVILHLHLPSILLRREARDLRATLLKDENIREKKALPQPKGGRVDTRPFSFAELGVRQAMQLVGPKLLDRCAAEAQPAPHVLLIGFDATNEAMAAWVLSRMWSVHFSPPKISVLAPDGAPAKARFDAHFPQAQAHEVWRADITFQTLPDTLQDITLAHIAAIEADRGPITAICVCLDDDSANLIAALALLRVFEGETVRPMPILVRESTLSEFSKRYGRGNAQDSATPFLVAFGQFQQIAEPQILLEGELDYTAALCHVAYEAFIQNGESPDSGRAMDRAARGGWEQLGETFRHANRAVADHAAIKLWDGGYRPAAKGEKGRHDAQFNPELIEALSRVEHARWMADRLLDGWKPGLMRNDRARIHISLVPWDSLSAKDQDKDRLMVGLATKITRWIYRNGVLARDDQPST